MQTFLDQLAQDVLGTQLDLDHTTFILPSKRAGNFLQQALSRQLGKTIFAPEILSIETFVEEVAGLTYASNTQLLFELYACYEAVNPAEKESFYHFSKWGQTLLQDFNEIDRYLVDAKNLFSFLSSVKEIERWNLKEEPTPVIEAYLRFWERLHPLYLQFRKRLADTGTGYQGMIYREAVARMEAYLSSRPEQHFVFAGFNALNKAEEQLLQYFLESGRAEIHWDAHPHFVEDPLHEAGHFIRQHQRHWNYLKKTPIQWAKEGFDPPPSIEVIGTPRNTSQVKLVGTLLSELHTENPDSLQHAAVVLGDESLLNPLLHALPENLPAINITMGYPLRNTPAYGFFNRIFELHESKGPSGWFHDHVTALLAHPYSGLLLDAKQSDLSRRIMEGMAKMNWLQVKQEDLLSLQPPAKATVEVLFFPDPGSPAEFIQQVQALIGALREEMQRTDDTLGLEYLFQFHKLFNELERYALSYPELNDLRTLHAVFRNLLEGQTVDFRGEPLQGLQVMGMLESRNLDFETVILTSVNEGVLPSGKSQNSLIPFDIKRKFQLPTYKEKDAVYSYHFYRLLLRAKKVYLLYNTVPDTLEGGERSRLISQLVNDPLLGPGVKQRIYIPAIHPDPHAPSEIQKNEAFLERIREMALKGFSPTSLSNYIRDPHVFYMKNVLRVQETEEIDTELAANVFGTIIHDSLEDLYTPFLDRVLDAGMIKSMYAKVKDLAQSRFLQQYPGADLGQGKNLIAFEVVVNYIKRFLKQEEERVSREEIRLLGLEKELRVPIQVPGLAFPVYLKGKVDRIETVNGVLRIVDYKTGKAERSNTEIHDWDLLIQEKKLDKAFQLLVYAYMYQKEEGRLPMMASIISFKNLGSGHLYFAQKDHPNSRQKNTVITAQVLETFESRLCTLITEICNPAVPIREAVE